MKTKYRILNPAINKGIRNERLKQIKAHAEPKQTRWQKLVHLINEADYIG